MSDEYYAQRAKRRTRLYFALGGIAVLVLLALLGIRSVLHDACTDSFDRAPEAVILAYANAISQGNLAGAQRCWQHEAYYQLDAGCSEICLSRASGAPFQVVDVTLEAPSTTPEGRAALKAAVTIACTEGGATHTGEIVLDSVASNPPWKHWSIVSSSLGGTSVEAWCR
jgi:hypothetical protein